jgi:dTDP-4-dehydrorhamnose reductase
MRRILLLGKNGQVGWELHRALLPLGEVVALDFPELDFTNFDLLRQQVQDSRPDVIVNAVAYTAVDQAEQQPDLAMTINARAPGFLAELACKMKAMLVHYSTDYVYDGAKSLPYLEEDTPNPLGLYAKSKLAGDQAILGEGGASIILRSSWIYSNRRDNFVKKVLGWAHTRTELRVVDDQVGCPTWARALAECTAQLVAQGGESSWDWALERRGVYHLAGDGYCSRYAWAQAIIDLDPHPDGQTIRDLKPARTADFPTPAQRPLFTALACSRFYRTFGLRLPDWRVSLALALES